MTNAELVILSLVAEKPRHGYDIETTIEARGMREWTEIGFSSIYYILKKLEKSGYVESEMVASERGSGKKVFKATGEGYRALHDGILSALSNPQNTGTSFLMGLANLPVLSTDEIKMALKSYRDQLQERYITVEKTLKIQSPMPPFVEAMFSYSLTMLEAEIGWVSEYLESFDE